MTPLESRRPEVSRQPVAGREATAAAPAPAPYEQPQAQPERADLSRIVTVHPRSFNDARTIGEHFRDGVPVIMNLSQMENADAKRLVDFAAGLILGLRGNIERVTSKVFLLSPQNVNVTAEEKERIAGGFFNQS
nr:cell division protein SepF [Microlunatus elymi]